MGVCPDRACINHSAAAGCNASRRSADILSALSAQREQTLKRILPATLSGLRPLADKMSALHSISRFQRDEIPN